MGFWFFSKRFAWSAACLLTLPLASPCLAAMPPLGYTGPVERDSETAAPVLAAPQLPAAKAKQSLNVTMPPLGYVGPVDDLTTTSPATNVVTTKSVRPPEPTLPAPVATKTATGSLGTLPREAATTMPPLGYVGEVKTTVAPQISAPREVVAQKPVMPPLGYVGPAPVVASSADKKTTEKPEAPKVDEHPGETLISATTMHADSATGIMTASGKVEIVRGGYILHADKVTYNQKTGVMVADGHVALLSPSGEVEFSEHQEITGDMKQAYARKVGILFPDNSRMAATSAQHYDERYTVAEHAAYTACNVCLTNPDQPPLWQLHAGSITHDNAEHKIYYHDTTVDFANVPIAYTPYMSGPDPSVKRLQGFLSPLPGTSPNIGEFIKVPYYIDISPDKDATITPTFSTKDKAQLATQYRERFDKGSLVLDGSFTETTLINDTGVNKGEQWRGHLFGTFLYDIDNIWRTGSEIQYASDKSYLHRYNISTTDQTTNRVYVEGFKGRDYISFNSYYFQDLRAGTDASEPIVFPSVTFSALGDPGQSWGGRWSLNGNTLITSRNNSGQALAQQGPDTRRLSLNGGWERQLISDTGLVATISGLLRTDNYWANNIVSPNATSTYDRALFSRQFGQANAVLRYPMGRSGNGYQQLTEPIVALTAAPKVRTITKQPIEDSLDVEFDETNLFSPNRFTGSDLIEGGSRVTYGMRNSFTANSGGHIDIFGGQSYDFTTNSTFPDQSGLNRHASDYVGRIDFAPAKWINANYGFRLAENTFQPQRQDAYVSFGAPVLRPNIRYIEAFETDTATNKADQVRQITFGFTSKFAKYWTLSGTHVQAFDPQPGPRSSYLALTYIDECFAYGINLSHDNTTRADVSSGTSIAFHFYLKSLGGLHTDSVGGISFPAEFRQTD